MVAPLAACVVVLALVEVIAGLEDFPFRIFGGEDAEDHEFPAKVFLLSFIWIDERYTFESMFCGGTIISPKWVLTAAHCVHEAQRTIVKAGDTDRTVGEGMEVQQSIIHSAFHVDPKTNRRINDIALLELEEYLPLDGYSITAAQLPLRGYASPTGQGLALGWGRSTYDTQQEYLPGILQKIEIIILACPDKERNVICVQSLLKKGGICYGDLGGPLLVNDTVFGVASYIEHKNKSLTAENFCNDHEAYGVYTPVISHRLWIKKHTGI